MDTPRTLYKIDKYAPGSEIAAETAAALAASSIVFRVVDPGYSYLLLQRSQSVCLGAQIPLRKPYSCSAASQQIFFLTGHLCFPSAL